MADGRAVAFVESVYQRTDQQVRDILAAQGPQAEVDDALMIFGTGTSAIEIGVQGCWMFDFRCRISGWFIQEYDGTSGSVTLDLQKAQRGPAPTFSSICSLAPPLVVAGRYGSSDETPMTGWATYLDHGDLLRVQVSSVTGFQRLLVALRIRRLEP